MAEEVTNIQDKSFLNKMMRRIVFINMLCSPVFVIAYLFFGKILYKLCMYGGIKKRGTKLGLCMLFFIVYFILYIIKIKRIVFVFAN